MSAEVFLEEQQESIDYLRKKSWSFGGDDLWTLKPDPRYTNSQQCSPIENRQQEQYSGWPCLVFNGSKKTGDEDEIQKLPQPLKKKHLLAATLSLRTSAKLIQLVRLTMLVK